jgi:hypothetical protein
MTPRSTSGSIQVHRNRKCTGADVGALRHPFHLKEREVTKMTRGLGGHSPSNIMHYLKGIDFPANKRQLEQHAKANGAPPDILEILRDLPEDSFNTAADVMKAFGEEEREQKAEK